MDRHQEAEDIAIEHVAWLRKEGTTLPSLCESLNHYRGYFTSWDEVTDYYAREWMRIKGYELNPLIRQYKNNDDDVSYLYNQRKKHGKKTKGQRQSY